MEILFIMLIGFLFGGIGGYLFWSEWKFFKRAIRLPGIVVDYQVQRGSKGGNTYAPVAMFELDGEQRRVTGSIYSSGKPQLGKQCTVGVDPDNIDKARIYSKGIFVFYGLFVVIGIALQVGAAVALFMHLTK